jgi:hypothetical protein
VISVYACVCVCVCVYYKHTLLEFVLTRISMWQVTWGRGSNTSPHTVVLEAGLDSLDFDEDLPVAPWL